MRRLAWIVLLFACSPEETPPEEGITYHRNIAPLIATHCASCHTDGAIAPFALDSYEALVPYAELAAGAISERTMPPYAVDNTGSCNTYQHARWVSEQEIAMFASWVDSGKPEGAPVALDMKEQTDAIANPVVADMGAPYTADYSEGHDDYRCFIIDIGITEDRFLTAFEVVPGNAEIVHHMLLFSLLTEEAENEALMLESEDPELGYDCYGSARAPAIPLTAWAPGVRTVRYPEGTGLRLVANRKLIMQLHYYRSSNMDPDQTKVLLELAESVPEEAFISGAGYGRDFSLPPGEKETALVGEMSLAPMAFLGIEQAQLRGVFPHMHTRGRNMNLTVLSNGNETCASDVPRYDFHWQQFYFYENAPTLLPEQSVRITCVYDTTGETEPVTRGENTENEMCLFGFYMTAPGFDFDTYADLLSRFPR